MSFATKSFNKPVFLSKSIFLVVYAAASVLLPFMALYVGRYPPGDDDAGRFGMGWIV